MINLYKSISEKILEIVSAKEVDEKKLAIELNKRQELINNLKDFPYSGSVPHYATLRRQGYRVLIVERHLVFYKVNESQQIVTIYAVVDGRREYRKLL